MTSAETTLNRHLQAIESRNVDTILADYADDAVLITEHVTVQGREQVGSFFAQALEFFTPEVWSQFKILRQEVAGDIAYIAFSVGSIVPFGTDTFVIRDGKIIAHTTATYMT